MFHVVVVTNCCRHGPVWYPNETRNLDQYLFYKSQKISTSCFLQWNRYSKCWHWLSSCTCIFKWPYDKSIFKRIKTFLINVTCLFFNSLVFRKCTHVWSYYLWTLVSVHFKLISAVRVHVIRKVQCCFVLHYQTMQSRDSCVQREISSSITLLHTGTIKVQMRS